MTIKNIAQRANVSVSTVSRVLNGKPDVNQETRDRVLKVIEDHKYQPSGTARNLALQRTNVIGFLVRDLGDANFPELARGIVASARDRGYTVMFFDSELNPEMEVEATRVMESKEVDGIIVPFFDEGLAELDWLHRQGLPVVRVYREHPSPTLSTIALDNIGSAMAATSYLIEQGHTRVAHLARDLSAFSGRERLQGYTSALERHGVPFCPEYVVERPPTRGGGREGMRELLETDPRPTAVFVAKDLMALGAYDVLLDAGMEIPRDMSVVGHDDIEAATVVRPNLTTMKTFRYQLGVAAVNLLFEEILSGPRQAKEVFFTPQLIERASVAPLDSR